MNTNDQNTIEIKQIQEGLKVLESQAQEEYHDDLDSILADTARTQEERLQRIGRLVGVVLKQPFATAMPINPADSHTGAYQGWQLINESKFDVPEIQATWQYGVLESLQKEEGWPRTVYEFADYLQFESGFWGYLINSTRKHICGDPALRQKIDAEVKASLPSGGTVSLATMGTMELANILVQYVPWLARAGTPLIAGLCLWLVLYIRAVGTDAFCDWSKQFQPSYGPAKAEK